MALDLDLMADDLDFIHSDIPKSFVYDGDTYTGSSGTKELEAVFTELGEEQGVKEVLHATVRDFIANGHTIQDLEDLDGAIIIFNGVNMRVMSTSLDTAQVGIVINLGDEFKQ